MKTQPRKKLNFIFVVSVSFILLFFPTNKTYAQNEVRDIDGYLYGTVVVGNDIWMRHNLRTTKLCDGTRIQLVTNPEEWAAIKSPAYTWYDNTLLGNEPYGALYNWYAVESGKLCPTGWHVPTDIDWKYLINALPYDPISKSYIGGQMKDQTSRYWNLPNTGATNVSLFCAIPAGMRDKSGVFYKLGDNAYFWSSTPVNQTSIYYYVLSHDKQSLDRYFTNKNCGFSVRCIQTKEE